MKDGFDITIDVRGMLNVPAVTTLLGADGKIYQTERPTGRALMTDIVVNALGITNTTLQKGSGNINCYATPITSGGVKTADQTKLMALSRAIIKVVDEQYRSTFQTWIDDAPTILQDNDGSYFVNIPFEYQSVQNYTNI
ncbi:MAG: hypothetical protein EOO88_29460 [Pedobacter sp.]|nr:MAG: hypothetical protein EOO88_29460 [Pedobacter sp.]